MDKEKLYTDVKQILLDNLISGYSKRYKCEYTFIQPSRDRYPFQFFWDCCFHVFILCALNETEIAKKCFRSLFAMQRKDGFIRHTQYWNNMVPMRFTDIFQTRFSEGIKLFSSHTSSLIQPPLLAEALLRIYHADGDLEYVNEMLPKLKKYYNWLNKYRDFDDDGLITIISPFESGMDWKASYDEVIGFSGKADYRLFLKVILLDFKNFLHGYNHETIRKKDHFRVKDVGFNTIYIQNLRALGELCNIAGYTDGVTFWKRAEKAIASLEEKCYDEKDKAFYDIYGKDDKKLKVLTPTIFYPTLIKGLNARKEKEVLETHFFNKKEFHTTYPIPSLAINDEVFDPGESLFLWRGPTWIVNNWFLHKFFMDKGRFEEAVHLSQGIQQLIEKSGFREYYNPFTGEGLGATNFTWAGLLLDMLRKEDEIEK